MELNQITDQSVKLDCGYRLELLVMSLVVVEVKAVTAVEPIHEVT